MDELMTVRGTIHRPDGTPLSGLEVQAHSRSHGGEAILGVAITDADGRYELRGERPTVRPFTLRVVDGDHNAIAVTRTLYANDLHVVDLELEAG